MSAATKAAKLARRDRVGLSWTFTPYVERDRVPLEALCVHLDVAELFADPNAWPSGCARRAAGG